MLKIAFFSNFLNHHQLPLCKGLMGVDGVEFTFVATEPIEAERAGMGYADMNAEPFVLRDYDEGGKARAMALAVEADVMIFGAAPIEYLTARMQENKLTFYFSERVLKLGDWRRFIPSTRKKLNAQFLNHKDKRLYVLGASAYMARDMRLLGFPVERCLRWGYFPEITERNVDGLIADRARRDVVEILYAGRLIELKRVIDAVRALHLVKKGGVDNFHLTVIGEGESKAELVRYVEKNGLSKNVSFLPFMPANEVRRVMDGADVYFFGSDFREGWGAVVNEAMNSACAVVVSHAVGSAATLIESGKNGLIYECGNVKSLARCFNALIADRDLRQKLGREAYLSVTSGWTGEIAASRLVAFSRQILDGETENSPYTDGVCSPAPVLQNGWIREKSAE